MLIQSLKGSRIASALSMELSSQFVDPESTTVCYVHILYALGDSRWESKICISHDSSLNPIEEENSKKGTVGLVFYVNENCPTPLYTN